MGIEACMIWIWLAIFVIALIVEACTQDFVSIWFSVGALVCVCICNTGIPYWGEIIIFSIVSLAALIATRPLVKKLMDRTERKTNVDDFSGKQVKVISEVSKFSPGEIRINDVIYSAILREVDEDSIPTDSIVEIVTLKGQQGCSKENLGKEEKIMNGGVIVSVVICVIVAAIAVYCITRIKIVRQTSKYVVERLGGFHSTWGVGFHFLFPFIDKVAYIVSMKEQVKDFDPQPVITKDNVTMQIDTVVFFQVTDPKLFAYGVENPLAAIENLSATTLRNIIGELDLDETLTSRDIINTKMRAILDEATDPWGIKVNRVEVKNILPPKDIRDAMERQMRAERERREKILLAEGEKKSQILLAEGQKESQVLKAEGEKESAILKAEGDANAILKMKNAEAEGIKVIRQAEAEGLKFLNEANATPEVLTLKSYEAMQKVADGNATKIIVPSEMQNLASTFSAISEFVKNDEVKVSKTK